MTDQGFTEWGVSIAIIGGTVRHVIPMHDHADALREAERWPLASPVVVCREVGPWESFTLVARPTPPERRTD